VPQTLAEIKEMLASRGLAPQKMFGQNFLIDHNLIRKLVDASGVGPGDVVLEVGPGTGTLTEELLARGCVVVACDIDRGMCALLRDRLGARAGFELHEGDCLDGKHTLAPGLTAMIEGTMRRAGRATFAMVANLPYACATPLMLVLLAQWPACTGQFVTIQKEVGERLLAWPSTKEYGPLGILAQSVAKVEWIAKLPPSCFWPAPDVNSAMIAIRRVAEPRTTDPAALLAFGQRVFEQRRKQLGSVLTAMGLPAKEVLGGVSPTIRAEAMGVDEIIALHERAKASGVGVARENLRGKGG
jgi:16S rRNA (adenine1518-N6/adenine1519-N6)-dimethyltransferase